MENLWDTNAFFCRQDRSYSSVIILLAKVPLQHDLIVCNFATRQGMNFVAVLN